MKKKDSESTLDTGLTLLDDLIEKAKNSGDKTISGKDAIPRCLMLHGFPYELTFESAQDAGLKVDKKGFDAEMQAQKDRARKARGDLQSMGRQDVTLMNIKRSSEFEYGDL